MAKGDQIKVRRGAYEHHGTDMGDGTVIHYTGKILSSENAEVKRTSMSEFLDGGELVFVEKSDNPEASVRKAEKKLGEKDYNLFTNNCEHMASECTTGKRESKQSNNLRDIIISAAVDTARRKYY